MKLSHLFRNGNRPASPSRYARVLAALRILTAANWAVPLGQPSDAEVKAFVAIIEQCGGCRDADEGVALARKLAEDFNTGLVRLLEAGIMTRLHGN